MAQSVLRGIFGVLATSCLFFGMLGARADDALPINEEKVLVLSQSNFSSVIQGNEFALVEFYAPWCGHCKALAPEYATAALKLAEVRNNVVLAKVDATAEEALAQEHAVDGYPTLYWFVNGSRADYSGGRDSEEIVSWVLRKTGPPADTVTAATELAAAEKKQDAVVVGYFADFNEATAAYATFKKAAMGLDRVTFLQTSEKAVADAAGLTATGTLALVTNFPGEGRKTLKYDGAWDAEALTKWLEVESLPLILEFTEENTERIFSAGIPRHLLLIGTPAQLAADSVAYKAFRGAAHRLRSERSFVFVTIDGSNPDTEPALEFFDVSVGEQPVLVGFQLEPDQARYLLEPEKGVSEDSVVAFARGILDGSVKPALKSEAVPENDMDGDVRTVVGKSFDDIVLDPTKDVLLEVYAPWCFHCKNFAPVWAELGTRFKGVASVVIAKMDGTANEHPELAVEGFPTVVLFPAGEGAEPIISDADRTLKSQTKFLLENAKVAIKLAKSDVELEKEDEESAKRNEELMKANEAAAEEYEEEDEDEDEDEAAEDGSEEEIKEL